MFSYTNKTKVDRVSEDNFFRTVKPIFHSNANPRALGPCVAHTNMLVFEKPRRSNANPHRPNAKPKGPNASPTRAGGIYVALGPLTLGLQLAMYIS